MEIYLITNLINGKQYVGQTTRTKEQRLVGHLHGALYIDKAIKKHGIENFTLETLEYVYNKDKLNEKEQYWIKSLNTLVPNGYNILPGGDYGYGRNTVHEFNQDQYLRKIFYPPKKSRNAIKCKIYTIPSDELMDLIFRVADFEPYLSNKEINELTREEFCKWRSFIRHFCDEVYNVVGHDNLCSIAKNITYAPSMSYIVDNSCDEYGVLIRMNAVQKCIHNHMLLRLKDEYSMDDSYDFLYITPVDNEDEYNEFAENKIQSILADWEDHPEKLEKIIQYEALIIKSKAKERDEQRRLEIRNLIYDLSSFLRLYSNEFSIKEYDSNTFSASVNVVFDKYDSGVCDNKIEVLVKCKDWIISVLNMKSDSFEQYHNDMEYERTLERNKKWSIFFQHRKMRTEQEKIIETEKKLRKRQQHKIN